MKLLQFDNTKNPYCPKPYPPSQIVHPKPMNASQVIHSIPPPPWDFNPSFKKKKRNLNDYLWALFHQPCPAHWFLNFVRAYVMYWLLRRERERVEEKKIEMDFRTFFSIIKF